MRQADIWGGTQDILLVQEYESKFDALFSSKSDEWATPADLFAELDKEFCFDLDPCATHENHKCEKYFTKEQNGLSLSWGGGAESL
jgi:site-specific DNA-methyltransferase (adenine-specific)